MGKAAQGSKQNVFGMIAVRPVCEITDTKDRFGGNDKADAFRLAGENEQNDAQAFQQADGLSASGEALPD